jgi:uncharacterized protein (DUF427 family)
MSWLDRHPANYVKPGLGQESVWDYPRPPRIEPSKSLVVVEFAGETIAETRQALRVLETSHPPTYYIPAQDLRGEFLVASELHTFCEFKGTASYWTLMVGECLSEEAGWYYPKPTHGYRELKNYVCFYPSRVEACYVEGERVKAQVGDFYGGWITSDIVGPFKGGPGTVGW